MKKGDLAFFYHSNCKEPGIVGTMEIVQEHSPDRTSRVRPIFVWLLANSTQFPPTTPRRRTMTQSRNLMTPSGASCMSSSGASLTIRLACRS